MIRSQDKDKAFSCFNLKIEVCWDMELPGIRRYLLKKQLFIFNNSHSWINNIVSCMSGTKLSTLCRLSGLRVFQTLGFYFPQRLDLSSFSDAVYYLNPLAQTSEVVILLRVRLKEKVYFVKKFKGLISAGITKSGTLEWDQNFLVWRGHYKPEPTYRNRIWTRRLLLFFNAIKNSKTEQLNYFFF